MTAICSSLNTFDKRTGYFVLPKPPKVFSRRRQVEEEKVWESLNEASLIHLDNSLLHIPMIRVMENECRDNKPPIIISWVRDFRKLGFHFKRAAGVFKRERERGS